MNVVFRGEAIIKYKEGKRESGRGYIRFSPAIADCLFIEGDGELIAKWLLECERGSPEQLHM
jgi:hypothetical protein